MHGTLTVRFRGVVVGDYRADLVVEGTVIVESKVAEPVVDVPSRRIRDNPVFIRVNPWFFFKTQGTGRHSESGLGDGL